MNIFKRGINAIKNAFSTKPTVTADEAREVKIDGYFNPRYRRSTTATRRFRREANTQYLHESLPINENVQMMKAFGLDDRTVLHMLKGEGLTYDVGMNAVKRRAKQLPKRQRKAALRAFREHLRSTGLGG